MTIALFGNWYKKNTLSEVAHILEFMHLHHVQVLLANELRDALNLRNEYQPYTRDTQEFVDFALSVGGDGTFLYTASVIGDRNIPILGINYGRLGFLADAQAGQLDEVLEQLLAGNYTIEQRTILQVKAIGGGHIETPFALNEVAVMKQELSSMIAIETYINGKPLTTYKSDGLVVSTPTGSTAYNLSVGGPLMMPETKGIILSPIATHSLTVRPLVIPEDWQIDLKVRSRSHSYLISVDGRSQTLNEDIELSISRAPYTTKLVRFGNHSFINSLTVKLGWGDNK